MLCMTLSHRINQTQTRNESYARALTERFYAYWGLGIRSLNEHLHRTNGRADDTVLAGILQLVLSDVSETWTDTMETYSDLMLTFDPL